MSIKQKEGFGAAQIILFLSIAILVVVVAVPVLLIFFNAFWVDGTLNIADVISILKQPSPYQALINSLIIAADTT